jgi:predicted transcriptional regulator
MPRDADRGLSRRERQIMNVLYRVGRASAATVQEHLPDPPSYSAVRALLRLLEEKGQVRHEEEGPRYVYVPIVPLAKAKKSALRHMLQTFFGGSAEKAVAALLDSSVAHLSDEELDRIAALIDQARKEGR